MTKGRKTTFEERLEIVQYCIAHDRNSAQTAEQFFDEFLRQSCFCMINNHVNAPEVICRFDHIIHIQHFFFYANSISFKGISGLIMCQATSLHRGRVCQDTFCGFSKLNDLSVKKSPKTSCLQMS